MDENQLTLLGRVPELRFFTTETNGFLFVVACRSRLRLPHPLQLFLRFYADNLSTPCREHRIRIRYGSYKSGWFCSCGVRRRVIGANPASNHHRTSIALRSC